jgi:DNA polymerase I-like protein with 3'-5' exonuclease and polymerase domains
MNCILDVETSIIDNGHPFNYDNKLVVVGFLPCDKEWNQIEEPIFCYDKESLEKEFKKYKIFGLFNGKFDLHWIRRILGTKFRDIIIRDGQLAEFLLTNQTNAYPSLNDCALKYFNEQKIDNIKLNYWDKGIDTSSIPKEELREYLAQDLELTRKTIQKQEQLLKNQNKWNLFKLQSADLITLQEMEYNGMLFNTTKSLENSKQLENQINELTQEIKSFTNIPDFNVNSGDHLSLLLYGGTYIYETRMPVGIYKTGQKIGQPRYKILKQEIICPRLIEPIKGSELKKEGFFSVDEQTIKSLKPRIKEHKKLLENILTISKIEKLNGTYYKGIPDLIKKKNWDHNNILHGQLNQCVARTGRLSSSQPNQQNFDPEAKKLCESRYD